MTDQLRILDALGDELSRATLADEQAAATRRWWRPRGLPLLAILLGLSVTSVAAAAAATHLFGLAAPVSAPRPGDAPPEAIPVASTMRLAGVPAADPDRLPAWDVRVSRSRTGDVCTAVGQVVDGRFGIVGLDRKFRELPLGAADACGAPPVRDAVQIGARAALGRGDMTARTLIVGVAGPKVKSVALLRGGRSTPLPLGRGRAFVGVLEGLPERTHPLIAVTNASGTVRQIRLADSGKPETPDPDPDTVPWTLDSGPVARFSHPMVRGFMKPPAGAVCAQAAQLGDSRAIASAFGLDQGRSPLVCRLPGQAEPVVGSIRRLVPSTYSTTDDSAVRYGLSPARTVAIGIVSPEVVRLELRTPDGPRPVAITGGRAFAVVLDGHVDPKALELRARLRDGSVSVMRGENAILLGERNQRLRGAVDPPWTDVATVIRSLQKSRPLQVDAGSEQDGPRVSDPAGGPAWAAHTWTSQTSGPLTSISDVLDVGKPRELWCASFGPVVDGQVRQARGIGVGEGPPANQFGDECMPKNVGPHTKDPGFKDREVEFLSSPQIYVDDPAKDLPKIARVSLTGIYPHAVRAEVVGLPRGRQVPATVGPRGATLALLPPDAAEPNTNLRFRLHYADGATRMSDYSVFSPPARRPVARAVDPKGGAGWSIRAFELRRPAIPSLPGQYIDGRVGQINDRTGTVFFTSGTSFNPSANPLSRRYPVQFHQQLYPDQPSTPGDLSPADIARRTLPGRTAIYGAAFPGVTRVTIRTPRDVRTVRPSKEGGLFLAVYDGRFTQGSIVVVADGPGIHGYVQKPANEW